ncbi:MAG: hypothetical protein DRJ56_01365 [Thermoprotei archaeon]|nr:MAG: hypothetical protein DRJ56_01365 [Thermoprotei archaeon]
MNMVSDAESETIELREGFTDKVFIAIIFSSLLMTPAFSWVALSTGVGVGGIAAAYVTMVIFGEMARFLRRPLTESELATIRWGASLAVGGAAGIAWRVFLRKSAITKQFGIADKIPTWWVPPADSPALAQRTIFHWDWFLPLTIGYLGTPFSLLAMIGLSFFMRQLYMEVERLPFPTGAMAAEIAKSLAREYDPKKYEVFSLAAFFAFLYGVAYYISPAIVMVMGGHERPIQLVPSIIDLTPFLDYTPMYGATIGITIDLLAISIGMIIPRNVIFGILVGSISAYIIGNHYLVSQGLIEWKPGTPMLGPGLTGIWQEPMLKYWMSISLGFLLAGVFVPFFKNIKSVASALKSFFAMTAEEEKRLGIWSGRKSLMMFIVCGAILAVMAIAFEMVFNPDDVARYWQFWFIGAPFIILGLSFINSLSIGRTAGLMGASISIPYSRELVTWALYDGIDGWFNPFITMIDGGTILIGYKAAELTYTKPMSIVKAQVVDTVVSSLSSLFFSYLFWATYDIPSRILPAPGFYPQAVLTSLYITKQFWNTEYFKINLIVIAAAIGAAVELVPPLRGIVSAIGLSAGFSDIPSASMALVVGWFLREFIRRVKGDAWVRNYLMSFVAGIWAGSSLAIALGTGITFAYQAVMPGIY